MTTIERNFNGTVYQVTVKEEERRMRMVEGESRVEETAGPGGVASGTDELTVKVISLEVKVGQGRGVLLQRWQLDGGEVN